MSVEKIVPFEEWKQQFNEKEIATSNSSSKVLVTKEGYVRNLRCELVSGEEVSHLEGKIKTIIDGLGLPEKQEKAAKDIVQTTLWEWFNFITGHTTDHIKEKVDWYQENRT